jgi:protein-tyrosine phosphatase
MNGIVQDAGLEDAIEIDSAGTGDWHVGNRADARSRATGKRRGFALDSIARQVQREDFERFDYLVVMDRSNEQNVLALAPDEAASKKVVLFRHYDPSAPPGAEVPDPYYGGDGGFDDVLDICERAARGLLSHLREVHGL